MWLVIAPSFGLVAIAAHAMLVRTAASGNVLIKFLIAAIAAGVALLGVIYMLHLPFDQAIASLLVYGLACELYTFLFTFVLSSVSVGLLLALRQGGLSESDLSQRYNSADMLNARLARLTANGLLETDDDRYLLTGKAERLLQVFVWIRTIFRNRGQDHARSSEVHSVDLAKVKTGRA